METAAGSAGKERKPHGTARKRTRSSDQTAGDLISHLPDDVLGTIISLLPTTDGCRTQILSHRWCHLWHSAPLNLEVRTRLPSFLPTAVPVSAVAKIISQHPGPVRRFCFQCPLPGDAEVESWLDSRALANLQELDIGYEYLSKYQARNFFDNHPTRYPLPQSAFRSASTLLVAKIKTFSFPDAITPSMNFPLLKELSLHYVSFSGDVFHRLLSGCHALESLYMLQVHAAGCLRVSSPTLRSIGFRDTSGGKAELLIEDAPRLQRLLLPLCGLNVCVNIRVIWAPKLEILGPFSPGLLPIFQVMSPVSSANSIRTVKVLALGCSNNHQLNAVLDVLRWFPCLGKLYVTVSIHLFLKIFLFLFVECQYSSLLALKVCFDWHIN
ncbi:hypothetical protein VPH35_108989 [Triticum aestivum]